MARPGRAARRARPTSPTGASVPTATAWRPSRRPSTRAVIEGFRAQAAAEPDRWVVVDGTGTDRRGGRRRAPGRDGAATTAPVTAPVDARPAPRRGRGRRPLARRRRSAGGGRRAAGRGPEPGARLPAGRAAGQRQAGAGPGVRRRPAVVEPDRATTPCATPSWPWPRPTPTSRSSSAKAASHRRPSRPTRSSPHASRSSVEGGPKVLVLDEFHLVTPQVGHQAAEVDRGAAAGHGLRRPGRRRHPRPGHHRQPVRAHRPGRGAHRGHRRAPRRRGRRRPSGPPRRPTVASGDLARARLLATDDRLALRRAGVARRARPPRRHRRHAPWRSPTSCWR